MDEMGDHAMVDARQIYFHYTLSCLSIKGSCVPCCDCLRAIISEPLGSRMLEYEGPDVIMYRVSPRYMFRMLP